MQVASLAGLALMKIVAWDERRFERDAEDLALIMRQYLDAGNEDRIYSEQGDCFDLLNEQFDYEKASARIRGRDVGRLLTKTSANYHGDYDIVLSMLTELRNGMAETDVS